MRWARTRTLLDRSDHELEHRKVNEGVTLQGGTHACSCIARCARMDVSCEAVREDVRVKEASTDERTT